MRIGTLFSVPSGFHALLGALFVVGCGATSSAQPSTERAAPREPQAAERAREDEPSREEVLDVLEGRASYYADSLAGNSTASGEPYDPTELTAASRDLPFGSLVRVTRVGTDLSVVVRVNDRGPFRDHSRILDLSRAAAEELEMVRAGVVDIRAEVLRLGPDS